MTSKLPEEAAFSPQGCHSPLEEGEEKLMVKVTESDRQAAIAYLQGNGPWKAGEIGLLPDEDYAVQCFVACALEASKETFSIVTPHQQLREWRKQDDTR